jgi:hypothetical protein
MAEYRATPSADNADFDYEFPEGFDPDDTSTPNAGFATFKHFGYPAYNLLLALKDQVGASDLYYFDRYF